MNSEKTTIIMLASSCYSEENAGNVVPVSLAEQKFKEEKQK